MTAATSKVLRVVDSHTCGQPTRVILDGSGIVPGADPCAVQAQLRQEHDWIRRVSVLEPRGHRSMFAAALITPAAAGADYGVVYMDAYGYPNMCGHATIGVATTLWEEGLLPDSTRSDGDHEIGLRTPAGRVQLSLRVSGGQLQSVAFQTPLAFHLTTVQLDVAGRPTRIDIAFGGQWYAFLSVSGTGQRVQPSCIDALVALAAQVRGQLTRELQVHDPMTGRPPEPINIVWLDEPSNQAATSRNVPVSPAGSFDRSPCGTATCARMATLVATGELGIGAAFVNEGLLGTIYHGRVVAPVSQHGVSGIVPEVRGQAWITARSVLSCDPRDPLHQGYLVGGGAAVT